MDKLDEFIYQMRPKSINLGKDYYFSRAIENGQPRRLRTACY